MSDCLFVDILSLQISLKRQESTQEQLFIVIDSFRSCNQPSRVWRHIKRNLNLHEYEKNHKGKSQKWNQLLANHKNHRDQNSEVIIKSNKLH